MDFFVRFNMGSLRDYLIVQRGGLMKKLLLIIPLVLLLCFTLSCQKAEEVAEEPGVAPLSDEDITAIKAIGPAMDKLALAGDYDAALAMFTDDVLVMGPNSPTFQGRSTWLEMVKSSSMTVTEYMLEFVDVDGYGDIAYARGIYKEAFNIEGAEEPHKDEGKVLGIFRKQPDGSWLIAVWCWNSDLPLPE
jgi:ketosteroid isomerase-like protein